MVENSQRRSRLHQSVGFRRVVGARVAFQRPRPGETGFAAYDELRGAGRVYFTTSVLALPWMKLPPIVSVPMDPPGVTIPLTLLTDPPIVPCPAKVPAEPTVILPPRLAAGLLASPTSRMPPVIEVVPASALM